MLCKCQNVLHFRDAAALHAYIVLDKTMDHGAACFRSRGKRTDIFCIVNAYGEAAVAGKIGKPADLCRIDHLICDQDIFDADIAQVFRLAEL